MRMKDKVALVSGAAGGMGAATARLFAREGAKAVVVADLLDKEGEAVVADIKKAGGTATLHPSRRHRRGAVEVGGRQDGGGPWRPQRAGEQRRHLGLGRAGPL